MPTGIHRLGVSFTTPGGVTKAPGATVSVFLTGTATPASVFTDAALTNPLANPFTSDANSAYDYYVNPASGNVDEQFSGTGITTPYTLSAVLGLDPRILTLQTDVTTLQSGLTAETAARIAADTAIQQAGVPYPLGGSSVEGQESASQIAVFNALIVRIDGTKFAGYTLTIVVNVKTDDAGTSVQAILRNLTTAANVGSSTASVSLTETTLTFTATMAAGVNRYQLQMLNSNADAFTYCHGYAQLAA